MNTAALRHVLPNLMTHPRLFLLFAAFILRLGDRSAAALGSPAPETGQLPRVRVAPDGRTFQTEAGRIFTPMGVTYYRPGTGWAPQVWKQWDAAATRHDFAVMKSLGVTCVRVFLTYGSFYSQPGTLNPEGLRKFDELVAIAEEAGIYLHPTGPDHWEGRPDWARTDRFADETLVAAQIRFWELFAGRYRGRKVIFAYDLLNEPEIGWDTASLRDRWKRWAGERYLSPQAAAQAWQLKAESLSDDSWPIPDPKKAPARPHLLDYQHFRESVADQWVQRQVRAIKFADPQALVTVGYIQWSVPALLPGLTHYAAFRPERQAAMLDFLEIHFYPLEHGFYEYGSLLDEQRNLAYLESVVGAVAACHKPVVLAEFGWHGGGQLTIDQGKHRAATELNQARWCQQVVETTAGLAVGWLNWGLYDQPEARDVSQLTGLLTAKGETKEWGRAFSRLAQRYREQIAKPRVLGHRPRLDWDACVVDGKAQADFREAYLRDFIAEGNPSSPGALPPTSEPGKASAAGH